MTVESLLKDKGLLTAMKGLVRGSGRSYPPANAEEEAAPSSEKVNGISKKVA